MGANWNWGGGGGAAAGGAPCPLGTHVGGHAPTSHTHATPALTHVRLSFRVRACARVRRYAPAESANPRNSITQSLARATWHLHMAHCHAGCLHTIATNQPLVVRPSTGTQFTQPNVRFPSFRVRATCVLMRACVRTHPRNPPTRGTQSLNHITPQTAISHDCVLLNSIAIILHWRHPTTREPDLDFRGRRRFRRVPLPKGSYSE